jgi:hypothetical protein
LFISTVPIARTLLCLFEVRGWSGWTQLERMDHPS